MEKAKIMKTPEEIKKGLECCGMLGCRECPYAGGEAECIEKQLHRDAYDYIQQLEAMHRTEYCEDADYDCKMLGDARKRIQQLEADAATFYDKAAATKAKVQKDYEGFVDVIHALADQIPQWISVKERLPENSLRTLVRVIHSYNHTDGYADIAMSYFADGHWEDIPPKYYDVTHWMPLPELPEDE